MKHKILYKGIITALLMTTLLGGCVNDTRENSKTETDIVQTENGEDAEVMEEGAGEMVSFRPVDCGVQAQELYEYPFIGLQVKLTDLMREKIDSRDVFVMTQEDYADATSISYAQMRFSATTAEDKEQEGMSVDFFSWEEGLEKVGVIGVYQKEMIDQLDTLTACDIHEKFGESTDGTYEYYLSTNSKGEEALIKELKETEAEISEMHKLNLSMGYTAFSMDREEGIENVGIFTMNDVNGETYTQEMFEEYDLTLVNVFTTWCSPCVREIPELEKLRQEYEEKGVKVGFAAIVLDAKTIHGIDESAVEQAKILSEKSQAQFPFLIPDESNMNGRLTGIESVPESFFVDKEGNIVSDPYVGANSKEGWAEIIDQELEEEKGGNA